MGALLSLARPRPMDSFTIGRGPTDSHPLIHFPSKPSVLAVRKHRHSTDIEYISLQELVETRCKSLFTQFHPIWWLFKYVAIFATMSCSLISGSQVDTYRPYTACSATFQSATIYGTTGKWSFSGTRVLRS